MPDQAKWFIVHTYSGYENKVADSLKKTVENRQMQDLIKDITIPTESSPKSMITVLRSR